MYIKDQKNNVILHTNCSIRDDLKIYDMTFTIQRGIPKSA